MAGQDSLYAAAAIDTKTNELIIKLVNASNKSQETSLSLDGVKKLASQGTLTVLQSDDLMAVNSFNEPTKVSPKQSAIKLSGKKINLSAAPYSFSVLRVKI